jgi:hypothetical protein
MVVSVLEEGFKFCLDTRNNGAPACPESLNVRSPAGLLCSCGVFYFSSFAPQEKEKKKKDEG